MSILRVRPGSVFLLLGLCLVPSLRAQTIGLILGDGGRVSLNAGAKLTVPLNVDLSAAGGATIGSLQAGVTWGIGRLRLDSIRVVGTSGFSLTANTTNVAAGQLTFNAYNPTGLSASGPIANLYFTGGTTAGGTSIDLTPTAAGNLAGETIAGLLTARGLDVCVVAGTWNTTSAKWGDANANGSVNVTDAQQLARYAVGLTVTNVLAVEQRGDVNADGLVDVLDAFLVARFAAGLPAGTRVNTLMSVASDLPPVASVEVSPTSLSVGVGEKRTLLVTPRAADGTSLAGCYKPTWASSQTSVATVSANGLVTAKAVGFATISVSVSGKVALASVLVGNPIQSGTLSPAAVLMPSGGTFALFAHWEDANGIPITGRVETWSSSDPSKAAVSSTGLLTALAPGVTIVTVTSEGKSASSRVTVVASAALTIGASGLRTGQQDNLSKLLDGNLVYIDTFYGNNGADGATLEFAATGFSTGTTLSIRYWNAAEAPGQTITATVEQVDGTGAPIAGTAVVQTWTVGQKDNDNTGPVQQVLVASASRVRLTFSGNRVNGAANNQWGWGVGELRVSATP